MVVCWFWLLFGWMYGLQLFRRFLYSVFIDVLFVDVQLNKMVKIVQDVDYCKGFVLYWGIVIDLVIDMMMLIIV